MFIDVRHADFDVGQEYQALTSNNPKSGGQVIFVGCVRDFSGDQDVEALVLSHYEGMTQKVIENICVEAQQRWELYDLRVIHRVGQLHPGDQIVLVAISAAHRADAFSGAEFIMDELKTRATFWKKEVRSDGTHWLDMKEADKRRSARWNTATDNK